MIGLSRAELAERAKLSPSAIQNFEEQTVASTPETVQAIGAALQSAGVIFTRDGITTFGLRSDLERLALRAIP